LQVSCVLHDNSSNTNTISRTADIQIGFNRPVDNTTLIYGTNLLFSPALASATLSYDNTTQILSIQPSYQDNNISSYTITLKDIKPVDQQSPIPSFTHQYKVPQDGLFYEVWIGSDKVIPVTRATGVRTDNLNYSWDPGTTVVWNSNIQSAGAAIKLSGYFKQWPGMQGTETTVYFKNYDDDNSETLIDNSPVIEKWGSTCCQIYSGNKTLIGGQVYFFERYHKNTGGPGYLKMKWSLNDVLFDNMNWINGNEFFHYKN